MAKDRMRYIMQSRGEVAPSLVLLTHQKSSTRCPKLETILEEGTENWFEFSSHAIKGLLLAIPVVLSFMSYYFLQYGSASPW